MSPEVALRLDIDLGLDFPDRGEADQICSP